MAKRTNKAPVEIELGDFVTIAAGDNAGWSGRLDNEFTRDGVLTYAITDENDEDVFHYATAITLLAKAA